MTKISFVLPGIPKPIGGFKFAYKLCKDLMEFSQVSVYHIPISNNIFSKIYFRVQSMFNPFRNYPSNTFLIKEGKSLNLEFILKNSDVVFVLSWQLLYSNKDLIGKYYPKVRHIVMDFPDFMGPKELILNAWDLPIKFFTISQFLQDYFCNTLEKSSTLLGCIVPNFFNLTTNSKVLNSILLNYSSGFYKNPAITLEVANILSNLGYNVNIFSREDKPKNCNSGISWFKNCSDYKIALLYSENEVFISLSKFEGFGLPALEALYYESLLITTDNYGNRDYLSPNIMTILNEEFNVNDVVGEVVKLINLPEDCKSDLRFKGKDHASKFFKFKKNTYLTLIN